MDYLFYLILVTLLCASAEWIVNSTYNKYSKISTNSNKCGLDVVEDMKLKNNLSNLVVYKGQGHLTDHYDPRNKSIFLSPSNYNSSSVAGVAVAAHEMGHAIQDKENYLLLRIRRNLGPVTIVSSKLSWIIIYIGFLFWSTTFIWVGIAFFGITVLFDLVTLPVELNASKRAKDYLKSTGNYNEDELKGISSVLNAAAFTYLASTLAGALQLLRLIMLIRRDD